MTLSVILGVCLLFLGISSTPGASPSPQTDSSSSSSSSSTQNGARHDSKAPSAVKPGDAQDAAAPTTPVAPSKRKKSKSRPCGNSATPPCPPPKVVVRNGGSNEPTVELTGSSNQQPQRSGVERINAATEESLKKIEGRQLERDQQETLSQVRQFIQQSKAAIASGDIGRGHNLALKASLLADELVKP